MTPDPQITDPDLPPFLSPTQALSILRLPIGRSAWYEAIRRGEVPGVSRVGKRWLLSTQALRQWAANEIRRVDGA